MSFTEQEIYDRLLPVIGAFGLENVYARRAAALAAAPEVRRMLQEHAHELAEKLRQDGCGCRCERINADLIDPQKEGQ